MGRGPDRMPRQRRQRGGLPPRACDPEQRSALKAALAAYDLAFLRGDENGIASAHETMRKVLVELMTQQCRLLKVE